MKLAELSKIITPDQDRKLVQVFEQHVRDMTAGPFANLSYVDWVERDVCRRFLVMPLCALPRAGLLESNLTATPICSSRCALKDSPLCGSFFCLSFGGILAARHYLLARINNRRITKNGKHRSTHRDHSKKPAHPCESSPSMSISRRNVCQ